MAGNAELLCEDRSVSFKRAVKIMWPVMFFGREDLVDGVEDDR